jgi:hypothetical protein
MTTRSTTTRTRKAADASTAKVATINEAEEATITMLESSKALDTAVEAKAEPKAPVAKKAAGPTLKSAADVAALVPAAHLKAEMAARVATPAGPVAPGYIVRWPKAGYDLLLRTAEAPGEGSKWLVRCNLHQTVTPATGTQDGDRKGRKIERDVWCSGCAADAAAKAAAPAKATKAPAKTAELVGELVMTEKGTTLIPATPAAKAQATATRRAARQQSAAAAAKAAK